jgi:hypothetical protein
MKTPMPTGIKVLFLKEPSHSYNIDFNGKNIGLSLDNRFFWDVS